LRHAWALRGSAASPETALMALRQTSPSILFSNKGRP